MATTPTPHAAPPHSTGQQQEIKVVSHSSLFYWWPVWAVGFLLGIITLIDGHRMAVVPADTVAEKGRKVEGIDEPRDVLIAPKGRHLPTDPETGNAVRPHVHMSTSPSLGVLFVTVLLLVIVITNVPLRGLWSVVVIVVVVLGVVILLLAGVWDRLVHTISLLDVRINMAGYFVLSAVLFLIWLGTMIIMDRQIYMVFTPGLLKVREEVGSGETAYDTAGMTIQKQRQDLFRHWILGLGSGDLIVRTSGANAHEFHFPNVLFVGRKLQLIEEMQRERPVVQG
jgi:uncharacterized membrane protein